MNKTDTNYDFITMFEEAQSKLERQFSSMESLRTHGKLVLGSSSIIVSLFSSIKLTSTTIKLEFILHYLVLIIFMTVFFLFLTYYSMKSILPYPLEHAIEPTWKTYIDAFLDENKRTILKRRVYAYLKAIKNNEDTLIKQYEISKKLNVYFALMIVLIIFIALIIPLIKT
ncbi:MAG: hypothetical protein WBB69_16280 [Anaerolineales bacterium]